MHASNRAASPIHPLWPPPPSGTSRAALYAARPPRPVSGRPAPAMIVMPGGRYATQADHEGAPVAAWLADLGIAAFVLRYRVVPDRHPAPLADARRAVRYLRRHADALRIDQGRIGVMGFSAGGHLAGLAATAGPATTEPYPGNGDDPIDQHDARPNLAVLGYPIVSLLTAPHRPSVANLLGADPDPAQLRELSLEYRVTAGCPPMFVWHTADDPTVAVTHALLLASVLAGHRVPFELHVYPDGGHGLGLAAGRPAGAWTGACAAFLREQGW